MSKYKIGDRVTIKPWAELLKCGELHKSNGVQAICIDGIWVYDEIKDVLCGTDVSIAETYEEGHMYTVKSNMGCQYLVCDKMIVEECCVKTSERTYKKAEVQVKYFSNEIDKLAFIGGKSDWIDLRAAKEVTLNAGEFMLIPLGIGMKLPEGYEAHVVPRSSTFKNFGVIQTNSMGVIDNSYSGDNDQWMFPALAIRDTSIHVNDRICQFRIVKKQPDINFVTVDKLDAVDRGGFGSTGKQ